MSNDDGQPTATTGDVTLLVPARLIESLPPDDLSDVLPNQWL